jgi:A118 family predicted phage portal protein
MPLPASNAPWPPPALDGISDALATYAAWYEGNPDALRSTYRRGGDIVRNRPSQYRGGLQGSVARMFWGNPLPAGQQRETQLHVPIAADICQASADLLFAEPPTITMRDGQGSVDVGDRLSKLVDTGLLTTLAEAAEIGAALSGSFLRVTWDRRVKPAPFLTALPLDAALPEFVHGHLVAVTFWWVVAEDKGTVLRHLERHEQRAGIGVIEHALYLGKADNLGQRVPLAEHPSTAGLGVDRDSLISTLSPGLAVVYVPNQRPARRWRSHPLGSSLGRSDLDGLEPLMDSLDEVYSSWMRDVRLGKGRMVVPEFMLQYGPGGTGAAFDPEQEAYAPLNIAPATGNTTGLQMQAVQFAIRLEEHRGTAQELTEAILRTAGYSPGTFGEGPEGMITATEVTSRDRRSYMTKDRKVRLWQPATEQIIAKLLAVDAAVFRGPGWAEVDVQFGDGVQDSPLTLAQTAQALRTAEAASTETLVAMIHPDWTPEEIAAEVARITAERPAAPVSPFGGEPDVEPDEPDPDDEP